MKKFNYLIIGNTGFIGKNLQIFLKQKREKVLGFGSKKIDLLSLNECKKMKKFINKKTVILYLSFKKNQSNATFNDYEKNIRMLKNLFEILKISKPYKLIFFSSQTIYGENTNNNNTTEKTMPDPTSYYGIAKYTCERLTKIFSSVHQIPSIIIRIPRVYGPGDDPANYGPTKFIDLYKKNKTLILWGDGTERRDYLYINDLNSIIVKLINKNFSGLVNICSGDSVSFIEIINNIKKITKKDFKFRYKKRTRPKVNHIMNNSYLKKIIGKYKFIKVEDGLKKLIYEKN